MNPPAPEKVSAGRAPAAFPLLHGIRLGALWMVVAGLLFACMGVFVKLGAAHFSGAELVFYRSVFGLLFIAAVVASQKLSLRTVHARLHLWRGLSGFVALMLFFYAIHQLPLATAVTLNYTAPLFLAFLMALVFRETPRPILVFTIVLGFCGVALLLKPSFQQDQALAGFMGLASGFFAGIAYMNVRQLGQSGEPEWRIVFYFTLVSTLGGALWMAFNEFHVVTGANLLLLVGMGTTATLAQLAMTRAYREGHTLTVGSLAYSTVVFASLLGILVWGETLSMDSWVAIAMIVVSGVIASRAQPRLPEP
jgi:drug/metabolite transporter (DMT)-like permease